MSDSIKNQKSPMYISFCTQKGGAGKSVFTILAASYLHNEMGLNVAVIDCDYPQWSVQKLRERDKEQIEKSAFYRKKAKALFEKVRKRTYPVVPVKPETALEDAEKFLENEEREFDLVLFDLPGTVNNLNVIKILFNMDYLFVPLTTSRINMESTLTFISIVSDYIESKPHLRLKKFYAFWNRIMSKENQELLSAYESAIAEIGISKMQTRIPNTVKYDREQPISGNGYLFLSTIFPPDKPLLKGSNWVEFMNEFLQLTNLKTR